MSTTTEQIKERLSIVDVVGSYIKLEKAGANFRARCPFHNEKTPSFHISVDRNTFYCFGCGKKGDIFSFVEEFEGTDFRGALKTLAARAGVELKKENPKERDARERLYDAMEEAALFFEANLAKETAALAYLERRGVVSATIKEFRIGYAPGEWRSLSAHLRAKGYALPEVLAAGLAKRTEKPGAEPYDVFRGRIMFPIADSSGRVVAFSGRIFPDDPNAPKYLNSPETLLYRKADILYGLDKAKLAIRRKNFSVLVEGQMDLVLAHQAGWRNVVAGSGTALADRSNRFRRNEEEAAIPDEQPVGQAPGLGIVRRLSKNVVIAYDHDKAGILAAGRSARLGLSLGMDVRIAKLPEGLDPADTILQDPEVWRTAIRESKPVVDFYLELLRTAGYAPEKLAKEVQTVVFPYLALMENRIEREQAIGKVARFLDVSADSVAAELERSIRDTQPAPGEKAGKSVKEELQNGAPPLPPLDRRAELAALLTLSDMKLAEAGIDRAKLAAAVSNALGADEGSPAPPDEAALFRIEGVKELKRHAAELLAALERDRWKQKRAALERMIKEGKTEYQKEFIEISKQIEKIQPDTYAESI
jgi:DNA primase